MFRTFTRINPTASALQGPYRAYQRLVADHRNWYHEPLPELPAEVSHLQNVGFLKGWNDTPEQKADLAKIDRSIREEKILTAAAELAIELTDRTRWLIERGQDVQDTNIPARGTKTHQRLQATVPLELSGPFADVSARVALMSGYEATPGTRRRIPYPRLLTVGLSGVHTGLDKKIWTYADVGGGLLDLAYPNHFDQPSYKPAISGSSLAHGFELRDMLTFVENNAPAAALPQAHYASHVGLIGLAA